MNSRTYCLLLAMTFALGFAGCNRTSAVVALPAEVSPVGDGGANTIVETTFDDLKFDMELDDKFQRSMLTPEIEKLFDQTIRIRGYIYPTLRKKGIKKFVLVRDNLECCFGQGAALFDCILVHLNEGKTAVFSIRPVTVEGKISFEEFIDYDGATRAIYRIDGNSVQ